MKLAIALIYCISLTSFAQTATNDINGYFKNSKKDELYSSFHFNGKGHAIINDSYPAEYFIKNNLLYIFPDKSVFIFKIEKNKIKGISNWVDKQIYKQTNPPKNTDLEIDFESYIIDPELLYQYYILNFNEGTDEASWDVFEDSENYTTKLQELCNKGLTTACGALFGMTYISSNRGLESIFETKEVTQNSELETIANKIIALNDNRGYLLLGTYYYSLGETEKAKQLLIEASENGNVQAALKLFEIELLESLNEQTDQEEAF